MSATEKIRGDSITVPQNPRDVLVGGGKENTKYAVEKEQRGGIDKAWAEE
jgi:hypothetical protein